MLVRLFIQSFEDLCKSNFLNNYSFTFVSLEIEGYSSHIFWCFVAKKELEK